MPSHLPSNYWMIVKTFEMAKIIPLREDKFPLRISLKPCDFSYGTHTDLGTFNTLQYALYNVIRVFFPKMFPKRANFVNKSSIVFLKYFFRISFG